eukprot:gnl/TRDRNA2_/TRDRNA2_38370_c0_seq1.p1 gnl/TRDRNA2_/TRDRNA2_38370_c0~~gnl/TRDRNA2_/TRDRNA2_38370_c0_seq1.p1  ORF type:complete len:342 (+),score=73.72 gnl/TRDRNA2_/TRDRNA2_38370_c0_seq1:102-1127(+)
MFISGDRGWTLLLLSFVTWVTAEQFAAPQYGASSFVDRLFRRLQRSDLDGTMLAKGTEATTEKDGSWAEKTRRRSMSVSSHIIPSPAPDSTTASPTAITPIVRPGFTMEEAMAYAAKHEYQHKQVTPTQVLEELQRGNSRFWLGKPSQKHKDAFYQRSLVAKQYPSVAILGCSDSRVPVEIIFDQGLGDIFVVRVAGNCLGYATKASLLYAVEHLKVKVIVVLGHEGCGAVKAACLPDEKIKQEPEELANVLQKLKVGLDADRLTTIQDHRARDREAVVLNVRRQLEALSLDSNIMAKVNSNQLILVGAFYEISSGIVDLFYEVTKGELHKGVANLLPPTR